MMWCPSICLALLLAATGFNVGYAGKCDGNCYSSGDPHYQTFDCQQFEYHGKCSYTLMTTCNSTMPYLEIVSDNERMQYHPLYAYTKSIIIRTTYGEIKLTAEKEIFYNDVKITKFPIKNEVGKIYKEDKEIVVQSTYGFILRWGSPFKAEINITDDKLSGNICGICGNANGNLHDDLVTPTNKKVDDFVLFADSWNAEESCGPCTDCRADVCSNHPEKVVEEAHSKCKIFMDTKGNLAECFAKLPSNYHHHLCVSEMCESLPNNDEPLCDTVTDYLDLCQSYGTFAGQTAMDIIADCKPKIDECADQTNNDCDSEHGECEDLRNGFKCNCSEGYIGDGRQCNDTDECLQQDVCPGNSECFNTDGSYNCTCYSGYEKLADQTDCQKVKCPSIDQKPDSDFTFGSVLNFSCGVNYTLNGPINLTCQADKNWSGNVPTCECINPINRLGMENGVIPDSAITASSYSDANALPRFGRLDWNLESKLAWSSDPFDKAPWIQVDLGSPKNVFGIYVQGSFQATLGGVLYVSQLKVKTGMSSSALTYIENENEETKVFTTGSDAVPFTHPSIITFRMLHYTQIIRIELNQDDCFLDEVPFLRCSLRFEVLGC